MSFGDLYDELSYGDKLVQEKLDMSYNDPYPSPALSLNEKIKRKLAEKAAIKREVRQEIERSRSKEPLVATPPDHTDCKCPACMGESQPLFDDKTLMVLVFILAAFCLVQYINQQNMAQQMNKMMGVMCSMMMSKQPSVSSPA